MMSVEKKNGVLYAADWAGDASKVWDESYNNFLDSKVDTDLKELADKVNEVPLLSFSSEPALRFLL